MPLPIIDRPSFPFEHRQTTAREDWSYLLGRLALQAVVGTVFYSVWSALSAHLPLLVQIIVAGLGIGVVAYVEVLFWGFGERPDFVCRIDEETLECSSPSKLPGKSFELRVADIASVDISESGT